MTQHGAGGVLILLRHGESTANASGLFTGLLDVPLSEEGRAEAVRAAESIGRAGLRPDAAFCSEQNRTIATLDILVGAGVVPRECCAKDWRLNERNYGALTGRFKADVAEEFGMDQFLEWRRSVDVPPPPMSREQLARFRAMSPYDALPSAAVTPTESLRDVERRVAAFHEQRVREPLRAGGTVLVVAHGNSLRGYCAGIDELSDQEIRHLNIPTGHPLVYRMDADGRPRVRGGEYVDREAATAAAEALRRVGGT